MKHKRFLGKEHNFGAIRQMVKEKFYTDKYFSVIFLLAPPLFQVYKSIL